MDKQCIFLGISFGYLLHSCESHGPFSSLISRLFEHGDSPKEQMASLQKSIHIHIQQFPILHGEPTKKSKSLA
jgi:hypothetical protein